MKHEDKAQFKDAPQHLPAVPLLKAITAAKDAVQAMTGLPVDAVAKCSKQDDAAWQVCVDVIESPARMGDNDLLATYQVLIGSDAEMFGFERTRRYHREDRDA